MVYPVVLLTTPTKIIDAAVGTGAGNEGANNNQVWTLGGTIKANTVRAGAYTATIAYTMASGI